MTFFECAYSIKHAIFKQYSFANSLNSKPIILVEIIIVLEERRKQSLQRLKFIHNLIDRHVYFTRYLLHKIIFHNALRKVLINTLLSKMQSTILYFFHKELSSCSFFFEKRMCLSRLHKWYKLIRQHHTHLFSMSNSLINQCISLWLIFIIDHIQSCKTLHVVNNVEKILSFCSTCITLFNVWKWKRAKFAIACNIEDFFRLLVKNLRKSTFATKIKTWKFSKKQIRTLFHWKEATIHCLEYLVAQTQFSNDIS